ncbi:MAG: HlyD family secretion protein [Alphaproteobacteria bacterium]|jgi:HlyD family secretion protein
MAVKSVKSVIKIVLSAIAIGALAYAFIPEPVKVDMTNVTQADLFITIEGEGKTRIHDIYVVSTPIDGRITRIASEPGDIVEAGKTVIANMYPANPTFLDKRVETQARADVEGAKAALSLASARVKQAQAQLDYELADFKRTKALFLQNTVSQVEVDKAQLRITTLKAELDTTRSNENVMRSRVEVAKATLLQPNKDELSDNLTDCQICIHSPVDGKVLRILHKSESIVPVGTPIVEIGNPDDLEVNIEMLSTNAVKVSVGDDALIKRWGGKKDIAARVNVIEPSGFTKISALGVEEQRVNVILSFTDTKERWRGLGDAFRVEASIIIDKADNAVVVPISSLFRENEQWSVFKVVAGVASLQSVEVGRRNDRYVEVIQGLDVGEQVITHPSNKIEQGVKVTQR